MTCTNMSSFISVVSVVCWIFNRSLSQCCWITFSCGLFRHFVTGIDRFSKLEDLTCAINVERS
jgi:hypothetical protein